MNPNDAGGKLTPGHLCRKAVVYLHQSSLAQVKHNTESQRLQYALTETASAYGFKQVKVIDWSYCQIWCTEGWSCDGPGVLDDLDTVVELEPLDHFAELPEAA